VPRRGDVLNVGGPEDTLRRIAWLALPALALLAPPTHPVAAPAVPVARPNIVILMTDDQRWDTLTSRYMPYTTRYLLPNGITYTNSFVPSSLCCPSRVSTLTGQYSHTTGIYDGEPNAYGGFRAFESHQSPSLATDLHDAGYRTALVGKYLNGFPESSTDPIPGWDEWFVVKTSSYFDYDANETGVETHYGAEPSDYATRVLRHRAIQFIDEGARPFFLFLSFTAPHSPFTPDPRDVGRFGPEWPNGAPPSYGVVEPDKPAYIADNSWSTNKQAVAIRAHADHLNAVYGVDRAIRRVWEALPDNTIVLFTSDNGLMWGEQRELGKQVPYNESSRVPLVLAGKNLVDPLPVRDDARIALNVDILPTLESLVGIPVRPEVEGLSLRGSERRSSFVLEHWSTSNVAPPFCGVRSVNWMYATYVTGEEEIYNEVRDPYELDNLVDNTGNDTAQAELDAMRSEAATLCTQGTIYPPEWPFPTG
jgi:arylsulfatase A-like enzyme